MRLDTDGSTYLSGHSSVQSLSAGRFILIGLFVSLCPPVAASHFLALNAAETTDCGFPAVLSLDALFFAVTVAADAMIPSLARE
jgi:hypothetical protein